jgi:hypothetical protein
MQNQQSLFTSVPVTGLRENKLITQTTNAKVSNQKALATVPRVNAVMRASFP